MEERKLGSLGYLVGRWPLVPEKPTLVFIHGAGGSSRFWVNQLESLGSQVNTVALDLPGHGQSDKPGCERIEDYARRVVDFVSELKAPRPVLVGLSMGGAIVQQVLLEYPIPFELAVLMSTGAKLKVLPLIFDLLDKNFPGFIDLMGKFAASPQTPREKVRPALDDTAAQSPVVIAGDFRACDAFDVRSRLSEIKIPVLVLSGEDDQLTPPAYADFLTQNLARASRRHFPAAGHLLPVEKPEEVNQALLEFLAENGF